MGGNIFVGDDGDTRAGTQRGDSLAERRQDAPADDNVVGTLTERDVNA